MTKEFKEGSLGALKAGDKIFYADVPEAGASGSAAVKEADVLSGWEADFVGRHIMLKTNIPDGPRYIILDNDEEALQSCPSIIHNRERIISTSRGQCVRDIILCMEKRKSELKDKMSKIRRQLKDEMSGIRDRITEIRRQTEEFKKLNCT